MYNEYFVDFFFFLVNIVLYFDFIIIYNSTHFVKTNQIQFSSLSLFLSLPHRDEREGDEDQHSVCPSEADCESRDTDISQCCSVMTCL